MIVNDFQCLPARIYGSKKDTGGHIEFLLLTTNKGKVYGKCLQNGEGRAQPGTWFVFGEGLLEALWCWKFWKMKEDLVRFHKSGEFLCFC